MALIFLLHPILFYLLPSSLAISNHHHHHHRHHIKSMHFTLYQHETMNKTGYIIVEGIAGPEVTQTTTPFGTIYAFEDPLTTTTSPSSRAHGVAEGTSITSSLDGLRSISIASINLSYEGHNGSISILGRTQNTKPADHPVVGGTGDFMFVQGYVTSSPIDLKSVNFVYKIEFHLYWPPYATEI